MPLIKNNITVTDNYADTTIGNAGAYYGYGTLIVTGNPVAVLLFHGVTGGQSSPLEMQYLSPGTYPIFGFDRDWVTGLQIKNAVAGQSPSAAVTVLLFEPQRAGLAPSAVVNPLASSGITRITSADGSVTITNATGPTVDLSVPGASGFLHWGTNTDTLAQGLVLNANQFVTIDTGGAHNLTLDARIGNFFLQNFWWHVQTNGSTDLTISGPGTFVVNVSSNISMTCIHDIGLTAHHTAGGGGGIIVSGDAGVVIDGGTGATATGVLLRSPSHGILAPAGNITSELASGTAFYVNNHSGTHILSIVDGGAGVDTFDVRAAVAVHGLTGATQATRYVGATTTGAPASGTFAVGDFAIAQDGHLYVCTVAGTPGTWADVGLTGSAVASVFGRTGAVVAVNGDYYGVVATALTGATQSSRYVGATTSGAPASGTFVVGDFIVARDGHMFICTVAGSPGTWVDVGAVSSVFGRTGAVTAANGDYYGVVASALTGATQASRYAGATTSGQPVSGTFAKGDFVVTQDGNIFVCTAAGTPGTWQDVGSASGVSSFAKSGATPLTGAVTISEGTGITLTQAGQDVAISTSGSSIPTDGWASFPTTLTYSSVDGPVGVVTTGVDVSGSIAVGMRIKFTQTTVKYFIVVGVSATTLTIYGGTDYALVNAAIGSISYSVAKAPYGFNIDPAKWTETTTDTSDRSQGSPTNGTFYNLGSLQLSIPIGCWRVRFNVVAEASRAAVGVCAIVVALSTANNTASDPLLKTLCQYQSAEVTTFNSVTCERQLTLASKTTYYLNASPNATGHNQIDFRGDVATTVIQAVCAYL